MTTIQRFAKRLAAGLVIVCALAGAAHADTPLLLYKMDQASSGTTPTTLNDTSIGTALNLTTNYGTGSWGAVAAGDGRIYAGNGDQSGSLSGTKVATALTGATSATLEVMVDTTGDPAGSIIAGLGSTGSQTLFFMTTVASASNGGQAAIAIDWNDSGVGLCPVNNGLHYVAVAADTTQATAANRVICYVDGTATALTGTTFPAQNTAIDTAQNNYANNRIVVGGFLGFQTTPAVTVYETLFYATTISSGTAASHSTAMFANNDADPNVGAAPSFGGVTPGEWLLAQDWTTPPAQGRRIDVMSASPFDLVMHPLPRVCRAPQERGWSL